MPTFLLIIRAEPTTAEIILFPNMAGLVVLLVFSKLIQSVCPVTGLTCSLVDKGVVLVAAAA